MLSAQNIKCPNEVTASLIFNHHFKTVVTRETVKT